MTRPKSIKAIFLLTVFKCLLAWVFFAVARSVDVPPAPPHLIMITALGYTALALPTIVFIHRRNAWGVRACIVLALVVSVPVRGYVAIVIDIIALGLTFGAAAKRFFAQS